MRQTLKPATRFCKTLKKLIKPQLKMENDKEIIKENNNVEEDIVESPEKSKYEKMITKRDVRKFSLIPKKIKRLKENKNAANSGINISANHIRLQLNSGNKMMVKNGSNQKLKFFVSRIPRE